MDHRKEMQKTLGNRYMTEKEIYLATLYRYVFIWDRKDDHIWEILKLVYNDFSATGLSVRLLKEKLDESIGINTIPRCLNRLEEEDLIRTVAKSVGVNNRENFYKITEKGALVYECFLSRNSKVTNNKPKDLNTPQS